MTSRHLRLAALCPALILLAACTSDGGTDPETTTPGIHFIGSQPAADSVDAMVTLTVEVRDNAGNRVPGAALEFRRVFAAGDERPALVEMAVDGFGVARDTTGSDGRATLPVRLGVFTGTARLAVDAPALGMRDTAEFIIRPGNAANVLAFPADSTVYAGNGYTVRTAATDRHDNPRTDAVPCTGSSGTITSAGCAMTGAAIGRGYVVAKLGTMADTAWVSVVPHAVVAAYDNHYPVDPDRKTVLMNLDGSGITPLGPGGGGPVTVVGLAWSPDGQELALVSGMSKVQTLRPGSAPADFLHPPTDSAETAPRYTKDGSRVFLTIHDDNFQSISLYWANRDGTGLTRFGPPRAYARREWNPSPSPDGRYVVYVSDRQLCTICNDTFVRTWDVQLDQPGVLSISGQIATWAPVGDRIAYGLGAALRLINADGTGDRVLVADASPKSIEWSPDGQWVLYTSWFQPPALVNVATGLRLPLGWGSPYSELTWRP